MQGPAQGLDDEAIRLLRNAHILRAERRRGATWLELAHDRLVVPVQASNAFWLARNARPLTQSAQAWLEADEDSSLLYVGTQLRESEKQLETDPIAFGELEQQFIHAGKILEAQRRKRRGLMMAGLVTLVLTLATLTAWALNSSSQAAVQRAEAIKQQGLALNALATAQLAEANARFAAENAQFAAEADRKNLEELADSLAALLASQESTPTPAPAAAQTELPNLDSTQVATQIALATPTPNLAATATFAAAQAQLARVQATQTAVANPELYAVIPDIVVSVNDAPSTNSTSIATISAPAKLRVVDVSDDLWINVELPDGRRGWVSGYIVFFEGARSKLPAALHSLLLFERDDLPFVYGEVVSYGGADGDFLLIDPDNEQSGIRWVEVGTNVTLLEEGEGSTSYGSGIWYLVALPDPNGSNQLLKGWLSREVLGPASQPRAQPSPEVSDTVEAAPTVTSFTGISLDLPFAGEFPITQSFGDNPAFYAQFAYDGVPLRGFNGLDFGLPAETPIIAVDDGVVSLADFDPSGFGNYVMLRHEWGESLYTTLDEASVSVGDEIRRGDEIGLSGNSGASAGPHLGFHIRINPYDRTDGWGGFSDPLPYLER